MNQPPLVSILIDNYNYGRFLGQAIESALRQTYSPVEVIVVDDGSTDDSRAVLSRYAGRVTAVLKENGGQASAFNAGFARSHGEVVIFLDSDDSLCPGIAADVVAVFEADPEVVKVQFRLEVVDANGAATGLAQPPWRQPMPRGDLRRQLRSFPDDIAWQPTSGNAFAARVLRQVLPMPEEIYRICADYYLANLPPLFGTVASLESVGGFYRVHASNRHHTATLNLDQTRRIIIQTCDTHRCLKVAADSLGLPGFPSDATAVPAVSFFAHRIISRKLDPERHPIPGDNPWSLGLSGAWAAFGRFDLSWFARLLRAAWFAAVVVAPRPMVGWLAQKFLFPAARSSSARSQLPLAIKGRWTTGSKTAGGTVSSGGTISSGAPVNNDS
jgi:glycosyltransferase involved in cell wall biosynthesis